jgi:dienelactone hydrolase
LRIESLEQEYIQIMLPMRTLVRSVFAALLLLFTSAALPDTIDTRESFLRIIERPRVALTPELKREPAADGLSKVSFSYATDAQQRVPGYLLKSTEARYSGKRPVVIVLHGTGGTKNGDEIVSLAQQLARSGFIAVAIDGRYHGERTRAGSGVAEYNEAIVRAWRTGKEHPFYYDTVWDVMRLVDFLETYDDVDRDRIGLTGFSKGGIETYLTAAADPRIAVAVPFIGVQSFKWAMDNGQWKARIATIQSAFDAAAAEAEQQNPGVEFLRSFYDRVVPGIYSDFDGQAMLPLIAPRPLLVINSDSDANTPIAGVRLAVESARSRYAAQGAAEKLVLRVQENTAHRVTPDSVDAAVRWFARWLGTN